MRKIRNIIMFVKLGFLFRGLGIYFLDFLGYVDRRITLETIRRKKEKYLSRKYRRVIKSFKYEGDSSNRYEKKIWVCWLQGLDNAPALVKRCIKSVYDHAGDFEVVLIDANNFSQYVDLPPVFLEKWKKGIISNTHFSDILRCKLLLEHGGFWIDSTCLLTESIPSYFFTGKTFSTIRNENRFETTTKLSSWFMFSCKNNSVLKLTFLLEQIYWEKNSKLFDYFLFHLFFNISLQINPKMWEEVPPFYDLAPHTLSYSLLADFNKDYFTGFLNQSFIHKLTYKFDRAPEKNSFYSFLIENY